MASRKVTFVVSPGFGLLDLGGPLSAFNFAARLYGAPYEISMASSSGGAVVGSTGMAVDTLGRHQLNHGDTMIVIGGPNAHAADTHRPTIAFLNSIAPLYGRMASICTGAFYLAEAGILDHRRATTHWRWAPCLQERFPAISVESDRIFINDSDVWTSAGITAGIDMALAMIEADFGPALARTIARELVVYHRRPGGQSQFSGILDLEPVADPIRCAFTYARDHLDGILSVERLADVAGISTRQFARQFHRETGETPARAIERMRAEAARPRVEDTSEPIEIIARQVGFGDPERMRRTFVKFFGHSPQTLRRIAQSHAQNLG